RIVAVSVEYDLAVTGGLDHDRLFRRSAGGQVIGPVEGGAIGLDGLVEAAIDEAVVLVDSRMNQDDIARLDPRREDIAMVALIRAHIIGREKPDELVGTERSFVAER